ncbi:MAG: SDR family oxidoreductase [Myxococcales bacterium]|nr:SDR family oxidoreductase [Myxococcales bacterium]MDH5566390.1 SDR family oxidoreductase [Myxococcales bacterium]
MTTILVTGANRGIGLELCRQLAARGDEVIAACRRSSTALDALGVRVLRDVEVTDEASVQALADALAGVSLDILVNNAGIFTRETLDDLDFDRIRRQLEVNALGPLRVTAALLPNLARGAKLALITSRMGSIADNTSGAYYGYRMSKAALNMAGASLARDLRERGVAVVILHPGMVATDMTEHEGIPVEESAKGLIACIDALTPAESGIFLHENGERLPW